MDLLVKVANTIFRQSSAFAQSYSSGSFWFVKWVISPIRLDLSSTASVKVESWMVCGLHSLEDNQISVVSLMVV